MADGQLYITISDGRITGGNGSQENRKEKEEENNLGKYATHELLHLVKSQSIKALNSSVAMIGNLEGEYFKQMKIQEAMERASFGVSIAMGAIGGAKITGGSPLGAVIGAGVVVVGQAVSWGFDRANFEASMVKQARDIDLLRQRSGLNSLYDGSRGTED